ncbi:MAG: sigma-70 family RNA polymerase sigma factor [Planctomycetota bacterium]|nr:MAG: sigma-70 family RNA polymerase sigma factor [Planctomycetota bacterium]
MVLGDPSDPAAPGPARNPLILQRGPTFARIPNPPAAGRPPSYGSPTMIPSSPAHDSRALLEHLDWVRRLARRLVRDESQADDLCQETWLTAIRHPPAAGLPLRGFLAGVCRNLARQFGRGEARRAVHERDAARAAVDRPEHAALVERALAQRRLVDHVLALAEPYRAALLMRYFEDLSPTEIARREAVPVATVKTRLRRGLERLRARLASSEGSDGRSWMLFFAPLTQVQGALGAATGGMLIVTTKALVTTLSIAAVLGFGGLWLSTSDDAPTAGAPTGDDPPAPEVALVETAAEQLDAPVAGAGARARASATPTPIEPRAVVAEPAPQPLLFGRVIDTDERPVPEVELRFEPTGADEREAQDVVRFQSDAQGRFELERPERGGRVVTASQQFATLMSSGIFGNRDSELVVVVARVATQAGRVVDGAGAPIEGAELALRMPPTFKGRFPRALEFAVETRYETTSDATGHFELEGAPGVEGAWLRARATGYREATRELSGLPELDHELVMELAVAAPDMLLGEVRDPRGDPLEGAYVALGHSSTRTDADGRFQLTIAGTSEPTTVVALHEGFLPVELDKGDAWPEYCVLHLEGTPLTIEGRVVDADGNAAPDIWVWTVERRHFGFLPREMTGGSFGVPAHIEGLISGSEARRVKSDEEGRFQLPGLLPRDYRLQALDESTLAIVTTGPIAAGTQAARIELGAHSELALVRGRVVNTRGEPIPGVQVHARRANPLAGEDSEAIGARFSPLPGAQGAHAITDEDGRFDCGRLLRDGLVLSVWSAPNYDMLNHQVAEDEDVADLELVLAGRCHLKVELGDDPERADAFEVLDADGTKLSVTRGFDNMILSSERTRITHGTSDVVAAAETARTLVLYAGDVELERIPLDLRPGELNVIRP